MTVIAWDCADEAYRQHAYKCMAIEITRLREALERIDDLADAVAVSKRAGAAMQMQAIAREALAVCREDR